MARLTFDPRIEDDDNAPLDVFTSADGSVAVTAMAFPAPPLETVTVGSINTEGDLIAERRHQNREVSLTVGVVEPAGLSASTNYATNPRGAVDATGWSSSAPGYWLNSTAASPATASAFSSRDLNADGTYVYVGTDGTAVNQGLVLAMTPSSGPFQAGTAYTASLYLFGYSGRTRLVFFGDASADNASVTASHTGWQKITLTWTPSSNRTTAYVGVRRPQATADTIEVTNVVVSGQSDYFDGDFPGCAWSGTAHASESTRPASGGPRFRAIIADLESKVAKVAREGGTLRWVNDDSTAKTLDLLAATGYDVPFDVTYFAGRAAEVAITLTALPYARGDETSKSLRSETTLPALIFTETGIVGDVPARGRLVVTEAQGQNQRTVFWGLESRYLDTGTNLLMQAEAGTLAGSVTSTADAGASGGNMARYAPGSTTSIYDGRVTYTALAHRGTYRVLVRARASSASYKVRLMWWRDSAIPATNDPASFLATTGVWRLLDLGTIQVEGDEAPWKFAIQSTSVSGQTVDFDYILLIPTAEGSGQVNSYDSATALALDASDTVTIAHNGVTGYATGVGTYRPPYEGDYLLVPPAGDEGRSVRFVVKATRAILDEDAYGDTAIDDVSARLYYEPRWLSIT
jgi:hypothetical protein